STAGAAFGLPAVFRIGLLRAAGAVFVTVLTWRVAIEGSPSLLFERREKRRVSRTRQLCAETHRLSRRSARWGCACCPADLSAVAESPAKVRSSSSLRPRRKGPVSALLSHRA